MRPNKMVGCEVTPEVHKACRVLAAHREVSMAELLRGLLMEHLEASGAIWAHEDESQ